MITLNPNDKTSNCILSNNNLTVQIDTNGGIRANKGANHGKLYYEISIEATGTYTLGIGIENIGVALNSLPGVNNNGYGYLSNGYKWHNNNRSYYGILYNGTHIIGVKLDLDNKSIGFYVDGNYEGIAFSGISATMWYPVICRDTGDSPIFTINFGKTDFKYPIPEGFISYASIEQKYLIKQQDSYYTIQSGEALQLLGIPTDNNQLEQWFNNYGIDDINQLCTKYNTESFVSKSEELGNGKLFTFDIPDIMKNISNVN